MRFPTLSVLLLFAAILTPGHAQEKTVQSFAGAKPETTATFQVGDKWELRWDSPELIAITVLSSDGAIVAGASGAARGSLFLPKGGTFYLQVARANAATSTWHISVVELGTALAAAPSPATPGPDYAPPAAIPSPGQPNLAATPPAPAPSAPPSGDLTGTQANAVVVIKGDFGEGTGFLVHTPDGPAVMTNLHVLSANPHLKIFTTAGVQIAPLGLRAAVDRDLALIGIQDNHYSFLDLATDLKNTVQVGDEVITPGNSEGGEVILDTRGKVLGIGPERVEISNPVYHGNSGGPVFHPGSGKVIAVVTQGMKVHMSNDLDKASFANKNSAIANSFRYFALRPDTVPRWEPCDWNRFFIETKFLKDFHQQSRCLDSYLNGAAYERAGIAANNDDGPPDSKFYLHDDKIKTTNDTFHQLAADADKSQRLDAQREAVADLESIADTNTDAIQNKANFYSFDQIRARQEMAYRKALRTELENMGDKISSLDH